MSEDKEESVLDTVRAAFETNQPKEEAPTSAPAAEDQGETHDEGAPEGPAETKAPEGKGDRTVEDKPEEPKEIIQSETKVDISRPPKRLPIRTKQRWLSIDPEVRADIWEREAAFDKAHARYDGLGRYAIEAERNGTTLQNAMQSYVGMETAIRTDPIAGYIQVLQAARIDPQIVFNEIHRRMSGGDGGGGQQPAAPPPQGPQGATLEQVQQLLNYEKTAAIYRDFENDPRHHYLEPLIPGEPLGPVRATMVALMRTDMSLEKDPEVAYDRACRANGLNPEARPNGSGANPGQAEKTAAVSRSRQAAKAIVGAPSGQRADRAAPDDGNETMLDTVRAAYRKHRGE